MDPHTTRDLLVPDGLGVNELFLTLKGWTVRPSKVIESPASLGTEYAPLVHDSS